jgi:hypothetical protein
MNSSTHFKKTTAIAGLFAVVALSSCTLPPSLAWRKIRTEGLFAYWSYELEMQREYGPSRGYQPPRLARPAPSMLLAQNRPYVSPANRPGMLETGATLTAHSVPALPGFVRSPYTNPPRLVDVKGAVPGSTMICPYTQRPFVVPSDFSATPNSAIANVAPLAPVRPLSPLPPPNTNTLTAPPAPRTTPEKMPNVVIGNQSVTPAPSTPSEPKITPAPRPAPAPTTPAPSVAATSPRPTAPAPAPAPAAAPKPVQEIPYGAAIAGRPGFVNSPFAQKHQLVDVTGLPTGMEVKCPYTGKLFRVPPQEMASTKPAETAPLASPEQQPKKK